MYDIGIVSSHKADYVLLYVITGGKVQSAKIPYGLRS